MRIEDRGRFSIAARRLVPVVTGVILAVRLPEVFLGMKQEHYPQITVIADF